MAQTTLREAHNLASRYWDTKRGSTGRVMSMRASKCVDLSGLGWGREVSTLTAMDATEVLVALRGYKARGSYYAAFTRMCKLSGHSCLGWPSAGVPVRRVREPLSRNDAEDLHKWLAAMDYPETADLLGVMLGTGMRVKEEALSFDAWALPQAATLLRIRGKGGHERVIPVATPLRTTMKDKARMDAMRKLSYDAHLKRWNKGVEALGITSLHPTPHAIRHLYATEAYARSGRNLHVVRELLGHSDINTTARYIGVDMEQLREAAGA